jgi:hypothetical protein
LGIFSSISRSRYVQAGLTVEHLSQDLCRRRRMQKKKGTTLCVALVALTWHVGGFLREVNTPNSMFQLISNRGAFVR